MSGVSCLLALISCFGGLLSGLRLSPQLNRMPALHRVKELIMMQNAAGRGLAHQEDDQELSPDIAGLIPVLAENKNSRSTFTIGIEHVDVRTVDWILRGLEWHRVPGKPLADVDPSGRVFRSAVLQSLLEDIDIAIETQRELGVYRVRKKGDHRLRGWDF